MAETTMQAELRRAGVNPVESEFLVTVSVAVERFLQKGGSAERAGRLLAEAAERLQGSDGGAGHGLRAQKGHPAGARAAAERENGAGGRLSEDQVRPAPARGNGANRHLPEGRVHRAPPREPSRSDQEAAKRAARSSARAMLDLGWLGNASIPDGPRYTDIRIRDLPGMVERELQRGAEHARGAFALKVIQREVERAGVAQPDERWVNVVSAERVREISRLTEMSVWAPMAKGWLQGLTQSAGAALQVEVSNE